VEVLKRLLDAVRRERVVKKSLVDSSPWQRTGTCFVLSVAVFRRKRHLHHTLLTWLQLAYVCFQNSKSCAQKKAFLGHWGHYIICEKNFETFLFRILETVLNNGQSAGNTVKNWRVITLKNSRLLISASLKINF
jgi:hypothetical protein